MSCRGSIRIDRQPDVVYVRNMQRTTQVFSDNQLGVHLRRLREERIDADLGFSLRRVASRCGVTAPYLSRVERGEVAPPGEETLTKLAHDLGEDTDVLLAMAGKISSDLRSAILARPQLFAELIRSIKSMPDNAVLRIVREVRDGNW